MLRTWDPNSGDASEFFLLEMLNVLSKNFYRNYFVHDLSSYYEKQMKLKCKKTNKKN